LLSIRILLVDDNESVRRGLRSFLFSRADFLICGEAVDGLDAIEKAKALQPDVVLMDITMPRMSGLVAAAGFEPAVLQYVCASEGKGKAKSAGGPVCTTRTTEFSFSLAA
jgi:DNA-binding LytR/AlgR family response regulator